MRPIAFCHIPKTGGTSIHQFIADICGAQSTSENVDSENYSTAVRGLARYAAIVGHFWFRPGETLDRDRLNITVLRHPIDRVLSHFYFFRRLDPTIHPNAPERSMDLRAYVESDLPSVLGATSNFQTRMLAPLGLESTVTNPSDDELLSAAHRAVDSFDLVGVFPELEDTATCIAYLAKRSMRSPVPRENVSLGRPRIDDIPDEVFKRLEYLNRLDIELYSYAVRQFMSRRRQLFVASVNEFATHDASLPDDRALPASAATARPETPAACRTRFGSQKIKVIDVRTEGTISLGSGRLLTGENVTLTARIEARVSTEDLTVGIHIHDSHDRLVFGTNSWLLGRRIGVVAGSHFLAQFTFRNALGVGKYRVGITLHTGPSHLDCCYDWFDDCAAITVIGALGYHFEGTLSLALSAQFSRIDGDALTLADVPSRPTAAAIAHHNPIVKNVRGQIRPVEAIDRIRSGDIVSLEIELESDCDQILEVEGLRPTRVCYRWLDSRNRTPIQAEGMRTTLGIDLPPGKRHRTHITVTPPPDFLGDAILRLVPVQENVGWFDDIGTFYCDIPVLICG